MDSEEIPDGKLKYTRVVGMLQIEWNLRVGKDLREVTSAVSPREVVSTSTWKVQLTGATQGFQRRPHPVFRQPHTSAEIYTPLHFQALPSRSTLCPSDRWRGASQQSPGKGIALPSTCPLQGATGLATSLPAGLYLMSLVRDLPQPASPGSCSIQTALGPT